MSTYVPMNGCMDGFRVRGLHARLRKELINPFCLISTHLLCLLLSFVGLDMRYPLSFGEIQET
jgi:hypothetical protein